MQGAYNPRAVTGLADLQQPVHDLFARHKWDQRIRTPLQKFPPNPPDCWTNVRYGSELDGIGGVYDAMNNQRVWDAMQPCTYYQCDTLRNTVLDPLLSVILAHCYP